MPELPIREAPISKITVPKRNICCDFHRDELQRIPVTMGGKTRCKILGGTNDMKISKKEAMSEVPRKRQARTREIVIPRSPSNLPYASGQGPRDVVPSEAVIVEHVPSE